MARSLRSACKAAHKLPEKSSYALPKGQIIDIIPVQRGGAGEEICILLLISQAQAGQQQAGGVRLRQE